MTDRERTTIYRYSDLNGEVVAVKVGGRGERMEGSGFVLPLLGFSSQPTVRILSLSPRCTLILRVKKVG